MCVATGHILRYLGERQARSVDILWVRSRVANKRLFANLQFSKLFRVVEGDYFLVFEASGLGVSIHGGGLRQSPAHWYEG